MMLCSQGQREHSIDKRCSCHNGLEVKVILAVSAGGNLGAWASFCASQSGPDMRIHCCHTGFAC
jgi:hypothetical protein